MPDGQIESVGALLIKVEAAARAQFKTILVSREQLQDAEKLFWHSRTTMADTFRTKGAHTRRMLKKAVQQGRSKRRGEAYASVR